MKYLLLITLAFYITACSSVKITYDYDKQADFAKYKTYTFSEDALKLPVDDLNRDRILRAVETELTAKGFSKVESNPDALIDLRLKAEEKTQATATTTGGYGGYGRYYGRYGYGGGFSTTQINYDKYVEGTLFVNLIDNATEKIVWQGRGTKTIDKDASPSKRESNINNAVKQIFTNYPPKK